MKAEIGNQTTGITMSLNRFIRAMILSRSWAESASVACQKRNFFERPNMVGYSRFHSWRNTEARVDASKVVMHHVHRYGCNVVLDLLAKAIRQSHVFQTETLPAEESALTHYLQTTASAAAVCAI